jgi:alkanesulfonate monooxygenase SsuD/methylene tetrahydromethanopterin reductase-like flavin-dependent oxidoreductase (luciferase family)
MDFGLNFFPSVGPDELPADRYWSEALALSELADALGYHHIRTVEHYFEPYGGYSPNPMLFLAAAAQRTKRARLITGAVLPIFNNPLKLAGEIGMLDAISGGRLEVGFARAFLPHEFTRFGRSLDESRARFEEGLAQILQLLAEENVTANGRFHSFANVTSLPRPVQTPTPPVWIAASSTPESFQKAGAAGYSVMAIPMAGGKIAEIVGLYREAWQAAGHPGRGRVMFAFSMCCMPTADEAIALYREPMNAYMSALADATAGWLGGSASADYPNYDKMAETIRQQTFDNQRESGLCWAGTPAEIRRWIEDYASVVDFEIASLQVNQHLMPREAAERSIRLFASEVAPYFAEQPAAAAGE